MRAFYYYTLMDLFGNVPLETAFATADPSPPQSTPQEIFAFIESELLAAIPDLSEDKGATYAKMNKWVAYTLLAKMYLNANNYGAGDHWSEAADAANQVINSGAYGLEAGYFANFRINNEGSNENIFVVPFDKVNSSPLFNLVGRYTHQSIPATFDYAAGTSWGGVSLTEEFYDQFEAGDKRLGMFYIGQQYTSAAAPQWSDELGFFYGNPKDEFKLNDCSEDTDRFGAEGRLNEFPPYMSDCNIIILKNYDFSSDGRTGYRNGARNAKFELDFGPSESNRMSNDFPIFRYAHVLLIRAEALWRQDAGNAESLMLINQIRDRAGLGALAALTEEVLFYEYEKELCMEQHARTITIRYGRWEEPWLKKPATDGTRRLYPIPLEQLNANPNLSQNPGY